VSYWHLAVREYDLMNGFIIYKIFPLLKEGTRFPERGSLNLGCNNEDGEKLMDYKHN
jgi:hypothetical protein